MEFRKVENELHLIQDNIPLFKFGEGYIKHYCFRPAYSNSIRFDGNPFPDLGEISLEDIISPLREYYGRDKGDYIAGLVISKKEDWIKIRPSYNLFSFPNNRVYITYTSDYIEGDEDFEFIEEEIPVYTSKEHHGTLIFKKIPLIYSTLKLNYDKREREVLVLSNDTTDIYSDGGNLRYKFRSFPVNFTFTLKGSGRELYLPITSGEKSLIRSINYDTLKEQFSTLVGGYKSLTRTVSCIRIPEDRLITKWSKYLKLSFPLRKILISSNKNRSCNFLKTYLICPPNKKELILQLGEGYLKKLIDSSVGGTYRSYLDDLVSNISIDNIKTIRALIDKYRISRYIFSDYFKYIKLRKELHKSTPAFPESSYELSRLCSEFEKEERLLRNKKPFNNENRKHLEYEGEGMIVKLPHNGAELILEGESLHHCVGGYIENVRTGHTNIVFLRKKDNPDVPFYTVELNKDNKLIQIRGLQNTPPTDEVRYFLERYLKQL